MGLFFNADLLSDSLSYAYCTLIDVIPFTCKSVLFPSGPGHPGPMRSLYKFVCLCFPNLSEYPIFTQSFHTGIIKYFWDFGYP
jgi:hypothetical protein